MNQKDKMQNKNIKTGFAKQTPTIEHFLNTCPAVISFRAVGDKFHFKYNCTIEINNPPKDIDWNN